MTPEMRKKLEEKGREEVDRYTWETRSDVSTAEHIFMAGAQAYESLLAEMAGQDVPCYCDEINARNCPKHQNGDDPGQDVEKAADTFVFNQFGLRRSELPNELYQNQLARSFIAGDAHGYARAKAEMTAELNRMSAQLDKREYDEDDLAEAVKAERERIAKEAESELSIWARQALRRILNPPKETP